MNLSFQSSNSADFSVPFTLSECHVGNLLSDYSYLEKHAATGQNIFPIMLQQNRLFLECLYTSAGSTQLGVELKDAFAIDPSLSTHSSTRAATLVDICVYFVKLTALQHQMDPIYFRISVMIYAFFP